IIHSLHRAHSAETRSLQHPVHGRKKANRYGHDHDFGSSETRHGLDGYASPAGGKDVGALLNRRHPLWVRLVTEMQSGVVMASTILALMLLLVVGAGPNLAQALQAPAPAARAFASPSPTPQQKRGDRPAPSAAAAMAAAPPAVPSMNTPQHAPDQLDFG